MVTLDVGNQLTATPAAGSAISYELSNVNGGKTAGGQGLLTTTAETAVATGAYPGQKVIGRFCNIGVVTRDLTLNWRASSSDTSRRVTKTLALPAGGRVELTTDGAITVYDSSGAKLQSGSASFTTGAFSGAVTMSDTLAVTGLATFTGGAAAGAKIYPSSDDGAALGDTTHNWSDLFLATGAVLNYQAGNVVITHSSGFLTMGTGDLRITSAGTNAASVVTVGGTQTLTNKTLTSPTMTAPALGVATGTSLAVTGALTSSSPTAGIGYATGAGGAQTQSTDKSTTVASNTLTTAITMNNAALNAGVTVGFTFTNSAIAATDTVIVTHQSAGTSGAYTLNAFPGAGSAVISVRNNTAGNLSEAIVLRVTVIKGVSA